jgi:UDP-glucose 4-epimerase
MSAYLITGATGFIGDRLVNRLRERSIKLDIQYLSRRPISDCKSIVCDLQKDEIPQDALENIDMVFHLAGYSHDLSKASKFDHIYRQVNVDATVRLAVLAATSGVTKFIFVSSVKAGGIDEIAVDEPEGVYGKTKREAEFKVLEIGQQTGLHVSIVRPSLVYGPGVKGNLHLMRSGIEQGWFPPLPETGNCRSMIHVDDLVRAILLVADDKRANGEIFIATDGVPHSSRDIYEAICYSVGKTIPRWSVPKILFDGLSLLSPRIRYKVDKLLGDEYYSSAKLEGLGFKAEKSLMDFDD